MGIPTILVEDNETIRATLVPAMEELAGLRVIDFAETASAAISLLLAKPEWELVVVDLFLKDGTGLEVLRACQARSPAQRVVVLTNYPTVQMRKRCHELGADAFFDKSAELDAFFDYCIAFG